MPRFSTTNLMHVTLFAAISLVVGSLLGFDPITCWFFAGSIFGVAVLAYVLGISTKSP